MPHCFLVSSRVQEVLSSRRSWLILVGEVRLSDLRQMTGENPTIACVRGVQAVFSLVESCGEILAIILKEAENNHACCDVFPVMSVKLGANSDPVCQLLCAAELSYSERPRRQHFFFFLEMKDIPLGEISHSKVWHITGYCETLRPTLKICDV